MEKFYIASNQEKVLKWWEKKVHTASVVARTCAQQAVRESKFDSQGKNKLLKTLLENLKAKIAGKM